MQVRLVRVINKSKYLIKIIKNIPYINNPITLISTKQESMNSYLNLFHEG